MRIPVAPSTPDLARPDRPGWRELLVALAVALLLAAWPVRMALVDPDQVYFGVDTAASQLPWSAHLPPAMAGHGPVNPDLSDQGICFYPFYRWVSRSWRAGDAPTWCPLVYAGAPGFGNAQSGALDPQVLLSVGLEAVAGRRAFDWGLALAAWLRVALALAGAYALARRLGLERAPSALAAVTFGFGGYLTLWLNHPLGHVAPALPWVLFFLEGLRGRRPRLAAAGVATSLALAILGGHAETAFFVGATGGLWALALGWRLRRTGIAGLAALGLGALAGLALLLPLIEYLELSAAQRVREAAAARLTEKPDLFALGLVLLLGGLCAWFVRPLSRARAEGRTAALRIWLPGAIGLALAAAGAFLLFAARGLQPAAALALVPDLLGAPGDALGHGYRGAGNYLESASPWVPFAALAFALAGLLSPAGPLARRRLALALAPLGLLLAIELPGLLELWRLVPVAGLGDTVRLMSVASLLIGLLAGEALQAAPRAGRVAALLVLVTLTGGVLFPRGVPALDPAVATAPANDELCAFVSLPAAKVDGVDSSFEGWLDPELRITGARLVVEPVDAGGNPRGEALLPLPVQLYPAASADARRRAPAAVEAAPEGAKWFRTPFLLTSGLEAGHWRLTAEFFGPGDPSTPVASRHAGVFTVERSVRRHPLTMLVLLLVLAFLVLHPHGPRRFSAWAIVLLALGQGYFFGRGLNPTVPRAGVFPPTRTEEVLAAGLGPHRFLTDPGVLPADTGLVRGLSHIEGYDAMDAATFNDYRVHVLPPGVSPLLAWNARAVDHGSPAFRLYGVGMLAMREPFVHPDWELVASPAGEGEAEAETWIYRARDPYPRAFCVPTVVSLDELSEVFDVDPHAWNPLEVAALNEPWRPAAPFAKATVGVPVWTNSTVRIDVELDGDGLLVLTDQAFPGWKVFVDGEERELLTADLIFRAVSLTAGDRSVEFRYEPRSIRLGAWVSVLAALGILGLFVSGFVRRAPR